MATIILCADDYGQNTAISQAIIALLKKNRLSATSCETNTKAWLTHAKALQPFLGQIDVGLHFNLTEGEPLTAGWGKSFLPLHKLILKAYIGQIQKGLVEAELNAQLDRFVEGLGCEPDFIDGHQHIQQLPIIRDAIISVYEKRLRARGSYIRSVKNFTSALLPRPGFLKNLTIQLCGAYTFYKKLNQKNIPHNKCFGGVYQFTQAENFSSIFPRFLNFKKGKRLIMCHPGFQNENDNDPIAKARVCEYQYFSSNQFLEDLKARQLQLGRFHE